MVLSDGWIKLAALAILAALCASCLTGCISGETGSRTVVGNHYAMPTLSTPSGEIEMTVYESTEGASILTRKDCLVEIQYDNVYTNSVLGVLNKQGRMSLAVKVEPLSEAEPLTSDEVQDGAGD